MTEAIVCLSVCLALSVAVNVVLTIVLAVKLSCHEHNCDNGIDACADESEVVQ